MRVLSTYAKPTGSPSRCHSPQARASSATTPHLPTVRSPVQSCGHLGSCRPLHRRAAVRARRLSASSRELRRRPRRRRPYLRHASAATPLLRRSTWLGSRVLARVQEIWASSTSFVDPFAGTSIKRFWSLHIVPISDWCNKHAARDFCTSKKPTRDRVYHQKELQITTPAKDTDIIIDRIKKSTRELEQGPIGKNLSSAEKRKFLVNTLLGLEESREAVYGTLDAWVAFEQDFPLASLKQALSALEKEEQWHRIVQVIKWMLSKGQGNTMRTYEQLVCALEKDNRAEEAHKIWQKKIAHDLQSVPWCFCHLMLAIYYRNNRLERLVKLFKELEACGRKPPSKDIIRKVEDAYEMLGLLEEKKALLEKYKDLYNKPSRDDRKKSSKSKRANMNKTGADCSKESKMEISENLQNHCCPLDEESAATIKS